MILILGFLGDVRGSYFPQTDYLFPSKFSDAPTIKIYGSFLFGELYEGLIGWGYMGTGLGLRYFGSKEGTFSDNTLYVGRKFKNFGISVAYAWARIGDYTENTLGGTLSSSVRGKTFEISASFGYIYTPLLSFEGIIRDDFGTFFLVSQSRPGIYEIFNVGILLDFGDIALGGIYRSAGNSFGVIVYYNSSGGPLNFSTLSHSDLGETISFSSALIFPR